MEGWLIENLLPIGHRGMDTAPEGSFKTICGCCMAVCVASGTPFLGRPVKQGPVIIVDEETPETSLISHLERFARGIGANYEDVPIYVISMHGIRFGRDMQIKTLVKLVNKILPVFIRMDSLLPKYHNHSY